MKQLLIVVILIVAALGLGFAWGASGRVALQHGVEDAQQQLDLSDARGRILDARVSLYNVNFGDAQRQLEDKNPLTRAAIGARRMARKPPPRLVGGAHARADAQRLASQLDGGEHEAGEALSRFRWR
jgi:hypothetical protein